ncbi:hypothetical protein PoB_007535000 [Plakobranchus ocellatus]|uniref:Uncharacterized protein n=1 Tax=Plakobranchus ocellatus TaxID=259542 RepID=A0AAV4DXV3_9GAST|nr:hypothetical protein PoB_007535000 [Plakobranchus ocellatus]
MVCGQSRMAKGNGESSSIRENDVLDAGIGGSDVNISALESSIAENLTLVRRRDSMPVVGHQVINELLDKKINESSLEPQEK